MKNVFFLFALLCAFFSSCSDEDGANVTTSNVKLPHVVTINSGDNVIYQSTGSSIYPTQHAPRENFPLFKKENSFPCKISLVGKR